MARTVVNRMGFLQNVAVHWIEIKQVRLSANDLWYNRMSSSMLRKHLATRTQFTFWALACKNRKYVKCQIMTSDNVEWHFNERQKTASTTEQKKYFWIEWNIELKSLWDGCNQFCECWHCFILMLAETPTLFEAIQCENYLFDNRLAFCNWSNWAESVSNDWKWKSDASDADIKKWNKKSYWKSESVRKKLLICASLNGFYTFDQNITDSNKFYLFEWLGGFVFNLLEKRWKWMKQRVYRLIALKDWMKCIFACLRQFDEAFLGWKPKHSTERKILTTEWGLEKARIRWIAATMHKTRFNWTFERLLED